MRKILFRGKSLRGKWVIGYYWTNLFENHFIRIAIDENCFYTIEDVEIDPETVGQYVGKNNFDQDVFEGDILHLDGFWDIRVEYRNGCLCCVDADTTRYNNGCTYGNINDFLNYKVIGNIHDNPELL